MLFFKIFRGQKKKKEEKRAAAATSTTMAKRLDYERDGASQLSVRKTTADDEARLTYSTMQLFASPDASPCLTHPRSKSITWMRESLIDIGVHADMQEWFDANVVCYLRDQALWPMKVPPKRFLMNYGQTGSGRTTALVTLCGQHHVNLITVKAHVRQPDYLIKTYEMAKNNQPCVVFFDNDYRITSDGQESRAARKQLYAAYKEYMDVKLDNVWTVISSSRYPRQFLSGEDHFSRFFAENGGAVYTPALSRYDTIHNIIVHILYDYTGSLDFQQPNEQWTIVIDNMTRYAMYHTINEIHTFIADVFRTYRHSVRHKLGNGELYDDDVPSVPRPEDFTERFNHLPSVNDSPRLAPYRNPHSDFVAANAEWERYLKQIGAFVHQPTVASVLAGVYPSHPLGRRELERQYRQEQEYAATSIGGLSSLPPLPQLPPFFTAPQQQPPSPMLTTHYEKQVYYTPPESVPSSRAYAKSGVRRKSRPPIPFNN